MKTILLTFFTQFFLMGFCYSQVIYVYNADEWELDNAISSANNGDTIMFDLPSYPATINIMSGYYISNKNLSIIGPSNQSVTLEAYSDEFFSSQIFSLNNNADLELKNLTLTKQTGGQDNSGQSLIYNGASLHINNCLLYNARDTSVQGAVIYNAWAGNLYIKNSTFSGNYGGQGGALYSTGNLDIESSTFYENYADNVGGGIFWHANGGYFNCRNSIFYNSTCYKYSNVINSLGYNISNDGTYGFNACTDHNNVSSIFLNQLQDNGGPTYTHSLSDCSIAINNGDPNITENDQRGLPIFGGFRDIGAFEEQTNLLNTPRGTDTRTECSPYTWIDGNIYTSNNNCSTHILVGQGANGCDSLVTLDLTIVNSAIGTDTRTECNSFIWIDGNNYTSSNNTATFNIVGGAANGCDSLVTLDLTIVNSATGTDTRTECNPYTWIDGNNYTSSNNTATFNIVGGAENGCDSLVTLDLTIINSATGTDTRTECNSFTWIDGNNYTSSNNTATFNIVGGAANGCDSLVTLNLTINSVSDITTSINGITISANNSNATYAWLDCDNNYSPINGETNAAYTPTNNGNYAVELTENGCADTSACVAITTVGILENLFNEDFTIYPNPTDGIFSIRFNSPEEDITLKIMDASGKLIDTKNYDQVDLIEYELSQPKGIYLIELSEGENQRSLIRLIKQ